MLPRFYLARVSSHALRNVQKQRKQQMKLRKWKNSFFGPPLHVDAHTWHVEGHGTTYDAGPAKDVGRPEPVLFNRGEGSFSPYEPKLNQPVNKGMSPNLLPIISVPAQEAGHLKYFLSNWPLLSDDPWVLETFTGYKIEFHSMPHTVACVNSPTGGCSSRDRQNGHPFGILHQPFERLGHPFGIVNNPFERPMERFRMANGTRL